MHALKMSIAVHRIPLSPTAKLGSQIGIKLYSAVLEKFMGDLIMHFLKIFS
jgi:hypothetical protein